MASAPVMTPPHLVMALVDDLGYAGVGFSSSSDEPITPRIDTLASSGALLTRHYTFKYCSPSRSSFLSGRLPAHVNQQNRPPNVAGGGIAINMTTIGTVLRDAGYATVHVGKWHGGMSHPAQLPINRGFDSSLAMLSGAADHWTNERFGIVDLWKDKSPARGINGSYSLYSYMRHALDAIAREHVPPFMQPLSPSENRLLTRHPADPLIVSPIRPRRDTPTLPLRRLSKRARPRRGTQPLPKPLPSVDLHAATARPLSNLCGGRSERLSPRQLVTRTIYLFLQSGSRPHLPPSHRQWATSQAL